MATDTAEAPAPLPHIAAARTAAAEWEEHRAAALAAAERRRAAIRSAHSDGMSWQQIGEALGVTRARAEALARHRIENRLAGGKAD